MYADEQQYIAKQGAIAAVEPQIQGAIHRYREAAASARDIADRCDRLRARMRGEPTKDTGGSTEKPRGIRSGIVGNFDDLTDELVETLNWLSNNVAQMEEII